MAPAGEQPAASDEQHHAGDQHALELAEHGHDLLPVAADIAHAVDEQRQFDQRRNAVVDEQVAVRHLQ
jgi:hypothetical protein